MRPAREQCVVSRLRDKLVRQTLTGDNCMRSDDMMHEAMLFICITCDYNDALII